MRVLTLVEHLTRGDRASDRPGVPNHFDTNCIVAALKDEPVKGFALITIADAKTKLDATQPDIVLHWAAERLGPRIAQEFKGKRIALVPIPGHACTSREHVAVHRVCQLASRIAGWISEHGEDIDVCVVPLVYWSRVVESAHKQGGTRDPVKVMEDYRSDADPRLDARTVVLIDDVVTTGARLCAAERYLTNQGVVVEGLAFAVARTVHEKGVAAKSLIQDYNPWPPEPDDDFQF